MLLDVKQTAQLRSLDDLIQTATQFAPPPSLGADIDAANTILFNPRHSQQERCDALLAWVARHQPCLFGRFGAKGLQGIGIDVCWIDAAEIAEGDFYLQQKIQAARRRWKENAAVGRAHGFLIMFADPRLLAVSPGEPLIELCEKISDLYLVEHAPVERDVIYTEAIPLQLDQLTLFKAGINIFYPSAHRTRHHDRRCPGGLLISINSPGHWANSLVKHGYAPSLSEAVDRAMDTALRSIGNGGMGEVRRPTCTWHNRQSGEETNRRSLGKLPRYIPADHSQSTYTALYHTDVLIPVDVSSDAEIDPDIAAAETWQHLILDYISSAKVTPEHVNYALFHGHPIPEEAMYHNPWPPRRVWNSPLSKH